MIMSLVQPKEGVLNGVNNNHEDRWFIDIVDVNFIPAKTNSIQPQDTTNEL
jgi:hypothetical protein